MTDHMTDEAVQAMLNLLRSETEAASRTDAADMIEALHAELAQARADAKAAVAIVVEKAAEILDGYETIDDESAARGVRWQVDLPAQIASAIRSITAEDAIAEVARIRQNAEATNGVWQANLRLIAERDRLAAELDAANAREAGLRKALEVIREWTAFPPSGRFWRNGDGTISARPMPYGAAFGSNGERDFMRQVARAALAQPVATVIAVSAPSSKADHIAALAQPSTEGGE